MGVGRFGDDYRAYHVASSEGLLPVGEALDCSAAQCRRGLMRLHLIAVGNRMEDWVADAYQEYVRRLPANCRLSLTEIPAQKGPKGPTPKRERELRGRSCSLHCPIRYVSWRWMKTARSGPLAKCLGNWLVGRKRVGMSRCSWVGRMGCPRRVANVPTTSGLCRGSPFPTLWFA